MLVLRSVLLGLFWLVLGKFTESDVSCKWSIKTDEGVRCSYSSQNHGSWEWVPTTLAWSSLAFVLLREPKSRGICRVTRYSNTHCLVFGIENCMKQKMLGFVLFLLTVWRWLSWQWLCVSVCLIVKGSWIRVLILSTVAPFQGSTACLFMWISGGCRRAWSNCNPDGSRWGGYDVLVASDAIALGSLPAHCETWQVLSFLG